MNMLRTNSRYTSATTTVQKKIQALVADLLSVRKLLFPSAEQG